MKAFRRMSCCICREPIEIGEEATRVHCGQAGCGLCTDYRHDGCPDDEEESSG